MTNAAAWIILKAESRINETFEKGGVKMYHVDTNRLNDVIAERNTTKEALAEAIGIDRSTFYRRLKSSTLTIKDIHGLCRELNLNASDASAIFLSR